MEDAIRWSQIKLATFSVVSSMLLVPRSTFAKASIELEAPSTDT